MPGHKILLKGYQGVIMAIRKSTFAPHFFERDASYLHIVKVCDEHEVIREGPQADLPH